MDRPERKLETGIDILEINILINTQTKKNDSNLGREICFNDMRDSSKVLLDLFIGIDVYRVV